jgi:phosphopantetheinyl transferase
VLRAEDLYVDAPFGQLTVLHYECADCYWLMTSEHTAAEDLAAMLDLIPDSLSYERSEPGKPFGPQARFGVIHYLWTYGRGTQIVTSGNTKVILAAKILG